MDTIDNQTLVEKNNAIYDSALKKYGISSSSVLWDDQQSQYFRFFELVKNIDLNDNNKSLLDVGCGNGELYKFLNFLGYRGKYTGWDINKNLIEQAKNRFNKDLFDVQDIISKSIDRQFDYVVTSGLFNTNVNQPLTWVETFLERMFDYSKESISFNAISTHVNYKDEKMYYIAPEEILKYCIEKLSPRVLLSHHNLPYNYTVTVYKDQNWLSINKDKKE